MSLAGAAESQEPPVATQAVQGPATFRQPQQIIVQFRDPALRSASADGVGVAVEALSAKTGRRLRPVSARSGGIHLLQLEERLSDSEFAELLKTLNAMPEIVYAEENGRAELA